jgi:hypothetical protein
MEIPARSSNLVRVFAAILSIIAWLSIGFQFYLHQGSAANFFSYFTILCNLLVAVSLSFWVLSPVSAAGKFFSSVSVQTAIAVYIFIVGLVYNLVLRGIWEPTGLQLVVDNLLHVIVPILYVVYWFLFVPRGQLQWKNGVYWIFFPCVYLVYSLVRGPIANWFPYPFLNTVTLGYTKVFLNIAIMLLVFLVIGLLFIKINRSTKKKLHAA